MRVLAALAVLFSVDILEASITCGAQPGFGIVHISITGNRETISKLPQPVWFKLVAEVPPSLHQEQTFFSADPSQVGNTDLDGANNLFLIRPVYHRSEPQLLLRNPTRIKGRQIGVLNEKPTVTIDPVCNRGVSSIFDHDGVYADDAPAWSALHAKYATKRINHSECYSDGEACTNQAESVFSRLRRAEDWRASSRCRPVPRSLRRGMDWREDNRRISNGEQYLIATNAALIHAKSAKWCGYWQRSLRREDRS